MRLLWLILLVNAACAGPASRQTGMGGDAQSADLSTDTGRKSDPFADRVVSFTPGPGASFGHDKMPGVVLGAPQGGGVKAGGLDVVALGKGGAIVLAFDDIELLDGPGPDLLVFENPFSTWLETGYVAASGDGLTWHEWPCAAEDAAGGFPGCAGVHPVLANPENGLDATDPKVAGGDAFDLADLGMTHARFVRIRDSGLNPVDPPGGGFDLDAIAVVNGTAVEQ